ncbi:MAG TPA: alcohol dehydrogenase catalytic domain-containing protein [Bacteroidales bacterium]|jgi:threonine dehydrogenase-like Zn-dependent dehydrogenase|nr:alcohol dehydrogenase catalytic domain-containing protein [Bacteroidales bacterium]HOW09693.1 alcohol dehydrogenase catalytic domain-containing protein [Bacteroidales bacterium]
MKKMNAAVLTEYKKVEWKSVDIPEISGNEVLVKVGYACICGSDQHVFLGEFHPRTRLPLIQGHEFAGTIVETGPDVRSFKEGDRVAVDPIIWCGHCPACLRHHYPACSTLKLVGIDLDGGFSEYMKVPETMLYKVTDKISDRHAALVEVLSIGFHACNRAKVCAGDRVVIWGAGKVGQSILQALRTKTDNTVIMVDLIDERLDLAKQAYNDIHIINASAENANDRIKEITGGEGVDVAFEAVGHAKELPGVVNPVRGCIQAIRGAGTVCVLGLSSEPSPIVMKELIWKEGIIMTSRVSHGEFAETIENMNLGKLKPDALVTDIIHPSLTQKAFEMLEYEPHKHLKIQLDFNQ